MDGDRASRERRARQLAADCFPPVDVVFCTPEEPPMRRACNRPFLLSILGTGVTVYRAPDTASTAGSPADKEA